MNAWPAATVQVVDGWLLRHTPTVARRRSNSALPPPSAAHAGPARRARVLDLAERFYARRDQPTVVQVSPAELHGALDGELAERGYRHEAPTVVLTVPIDRLPARPRGAPDLALSVAATATPQWLAGWTAIEGRPDADATGRLVLARIGPPTGYLTATHQGDVLGVALLVVEQGLGRSVLHGHPTRGPGPRRRHRRPGSGQPAGPPPRGPRTSTSRSRRTTSRPSGSTAGSVSSRPTTTTTAWHRNGDASQARDSPQIWSGSDQAPRLRSGGRRGAAPPASRGS